jgi:DNA polymerase V
MQLWLRTYADRISAGFPSAAEGYEDEPLNLHDWLVRRPAATFFYRVQGNVLRGEGIRHGSLLVVDRSIVPKLGRLVLAEEDGVFTVRRYRPRTTMTVCGVVVAAVTRF